MTVSCIEHQTPNCRTKGGNIMHIQKRSRRVRAVVVGTLLAGVMSVGAVTDTASAAKPDADVSVDESGVQFKIEIPVTPLRSGIRW